jgi:hypothetical protein
MKREIINYRDLFDDGELNILVRDVLMEHYELLYESGADPQADLLLGAIKYFTLPSEWEAFKEEFNIEDDQI